jgi:hypothetical protein
MDRWFAVRRGVAKPIPQVSLWPQRLMEIQVAIVYFTTFWHKWQGNMWREGTATWMTTNLHEFDRFPVPAFVDRQPFVMATTWWTLLVEIAMGTIVFNRKCRKWVLLNAVVLHLGIEWRMNIPLFAFIMIASYVVFYEGDEVDSWLNRARAKIKSWRDKETKADAVSAA